jgi:hypothetical protein
LVDHPRDFLEPVPAAEQRSADELLEQSQLRPRLAQNIPICTVWATGRETVIGMPNGGSRVAQGNVP